MKSLAESQPARRSSPLFCPDEVNEVEEVYLLDLEQLKSVHPEFHHVTFKVEPSPDFPLHLITNGAQYAWRTDKLIQPFFTINELVIWGLTAKILHHFLQIEKD
jgi:coenzyme A diphosphatase NUDT7